MLVIIIIIIINIKYGLITLRFMVIFIGLTKNIYQNGKYIYYDSTSEIVHRYLPVLTGTEIFCYNGQTETGFEMVFITLVLITWKHLKYVFSFHNSSLNNQRIEWWKQKLETHPNTLLSRGAHQFWVMGDGN